MKKVILALLCLIAVLGVSAQNANRTGFFIEAGIGGTTGSTPRIGLSNDNGTVMARYAGGTSFNFNFGQRIRTSTHMAVEFRFGLQAPIDYVTTVPTGKILFGLRYTSSELFGNMSIYANAAVGGAIGASYVWGDGVPTGPDLVKFDFSNANDASFGAGYLLGVGLNITTHFYAGFVWDAQYMIKQCRKHQEDNLNWGMAGLQIGYRF